MTHHELQVVPAQECLSLAFSAIEIPSSTDPATVYTVLVTPWRDPSAYICQCKSYLYRGHCKHQMEAHARICGWKEVRDKKYVDLKQTADQQEGMVCPKCLGPTRWGMEWIYVEES